MTSLLTKLLTALWPFLKESLLGINDHPHKDRRGKATNQVPVILGLVAIVIFLGDYSVKMQADIDKLKAEIIDLKNPKDFLQVQMELHLCKKDLENVVSQLGRTESDLQTSTDSCEVRIDRVRTGMQSIQTRPPVSIGESTKQRAIRKLEKLKHSEVPN